MIRSITLGIFLGTAMAATAPAEAVTNDTAFEAARGEGCIAIRMRLTESLEDLLSKMPSTDPSKPAPALADDGGSQEAARMLLLQHVHELSDIYRNLNCDQIGQ